MTKLLVGRVSATRSRTMAAIRARDTKAEIRLRRSVHALGLRYKLHTKDLPGRPDFAFINQKIAVFCDGDFWHGRRWHLRKPKLLKGVRAKYWITKIEGNMARDRRTARELRRLGWTVLRFWETDILRSADQIALRIEKIVRGESKTRI